MQSSREPGKGPGSSSASHSALDRVGGRTDTSTTVNAINVSTGHTRIGDVLMGANIVSDDFIKSALTNFEERGMPLGKILTSSGYLSEAQLKLALDIQSLINDRRLPFDIGVKVLSLAHNEGLTLPEAFEKAKVVQPDDLLSNKLGQLLTGAGVINQAVLDDALGVSQSSGLPLGHIFCYRGFLSQQLLETALLGQQLVRRGSLSRESCIAAITKAFAREQALENLPFNAGFVRSMTRQTPRLGELVFEGEFISDNQLITALQLSLSSGITSGAAMISCANLPPEVILACVEMQEMMDNELLSPRLAFDTLFNMREFGYAFDRALAEACNDTPLVNHSSILAELLSQAGLLKCAVPELPEEIQERILLSYNQTKEVTRMLLESKLADEHAIYGALRLVYLLKNEKVAFEQAKSALEIAFRTPLFVDEALYRLGLKKRTRLREPSSPPRPVAT